MSNLIVSVSPHYHSKNSTQRIMLDVILALMPALIASVMIFGINSLLLTVISAGNCVLLEWAWNKIRKQPQTVSDLSAVVTGILLAFNVPASMPIWKLMVGDFIAIIIVKMLFGGLGCNFVNPALVGRVALMQSFAGNMSSYGCDIASGATADLLSSATPLAVIDKLDWSDFETLLLGQHGGVLGETCALALIVGGIYLVVRGVIKPVIPAVYVAGTFVFTFLFNGFNAQAAFLSLFAGGLMLGAIFMATDYVTSPLTNQGKAIFAIGCAFITSAIRCFGSLAEGTSFAILLMNLLVSYINGWTKTKPLGGAKA